MGVVIADGAICAEDEIEVEMPIEPFEPLKYLLPKRGP